MKSKTKDRRQDIVDAAIVCFGKFGVINTTFSQIAKQAKVHQPLISYYFLDFEALFVAVVQQMLKDVQGQSVEAIDRHSKDAKKAIVEYTKANFDWARARPHYNPLWTFFYHLASYNETFSTINSSIRKVGRERVALLLYRYQEQNDLKLEKGWDVGRLAHAIHTQITGDMIGAVTEKTDLAKASQLCQDAVVLLLEKAFH